MPSEELKDGCRSHPFMPSCLLSACYVLYTDLGAVATEKTKQKKKKKFALMEFTICEEKQIKAIFR